MLFFWIAAVLSGLLFGVLFAKRSNWFSTGVMDPSTTSLSSVGYAADRNTWKNVYQNGNKIGVSHSTFTRTENGYQLHETLYLRINTMGMIQNISLDTNGKLNPDFSLSAFDFEISSGRFRFTATGSVSNDTLTIITSTAGSARKSTIKLQKKIFLTAGIIDAVMASDLTPEGVLAVDVFDPASMSQVPVRVKIIGYEQISIMDKVQKAKKISLNFKGVTLFAWVSDEGEILKEQGLLGISLEKTNREQALSGLPIQASQDLTQIASVPANITIDNAQQLDKLSVKISGISFQNINLDGGRQTFKNNILTVTRETLSDDLSAAGTGDFMTVQSKYLKPSAFIQSDHPNIRNLARKIVAPSDPPLMKVQKIVGWIHQNIEKRPVLSLPDALSTLKNRVGDCNEHAMLLSALTRAVGIPSRIETGLVYLNGRFYYHAWNALFLGRWITADSLFGQIPADVTHLRFSSGAQSLGLDILTIIGKVDLHIIAEKADFR